MSTAPPPVPPPPSSATVPGAAPAEPTHEDLEGVLAFTSLDEFVREYLTQVVHRRLNRSVQLWCPEWWRHPEAIARLAVLWRAFEFLRTDPALGMSTWWLHHADPHLHALMNPQYGPFVSCDPREGHSDETQPGPLPTVPAPQELMDLPEFALQPEDLEQDFDTPDEPYQPRSEEDDGSDGGGKRKSKDMVIGREDGK